MALPPPGSNVQVIIPGAGGLQGSAKAAAASNSAGKEKPKAETKSEAQKAKEKFDLVLGSNKTDVKEVNNAKDAGGNHYRVTLPDTVQKGEITQLLRDFGITDSQSIESIVGKDGKNLGHAGIRYECSGKVLARGLKSVGYPEARIEKAFKHHDTADIIEMVTGQWTGGVRPGFETAVVTISDKSDPANSTYTVSGVAKGADVTALFDIADVFVMEDDPAKPDPSKPGQYLKKKKLDGANKSIQKTDNAGKPLIKAKGDGAYVLTISKEALEVGVEVTLGEDVKRRIAARGTTSHLNDDPTAEKPLPPVVLKDLRLTDGGGGDYDGLRVQDIDEPEHEPWATSKLNPLNRGIAEKKKHMRPEDEVKQAIYKKMQNVTVVYNKDTVGGSGGYELHLAKGMDAKKIAKELGIPEKELHREGEIEPKARWYIAKTMMNDIIPDFAAKSTEGQEKALAALETPEKLTMLGIPRKHRFDTLVNNPPIEAAFLAEIAEDPKKKEDEKNAGKRATLGSARRKTELEAAIKSGELPQSKPGLGDVTVKETSSHYIIDNVVPGTSREVLFDALDQEAFKKKDKIETALLGPVVMSVSEEVMHTVFDIKSQKTEIGA